MREAEAGYERHDADPRIEVSLLEARAIQMLAVTGLASNNAARLA